MMKELTMAALVAGATGLTKADARDKTFPKSDKVEHCKATFGNRFGITLAADVYKPEEGNPPSPELPPPLKLRRFLNSAIFAATWSASGCPDTSKSPAETRQALP